MQEEVREVRQDARLRGEGLIEEDHIIEERSAPPRKRLDEQALHEPIRLLPYTPPVCVSPQTSVAEAVRAMKEKGIGGILVQENERLVGIFTERDLLNKLIGSGRDLDQTPVADVMTAETEALPVDADIAFALRMMGEGIPHLSLLSQQEFALRMMGEGGYRRIPLVDEDDRPVGILSVKHIISYLAEFFPQDVLNLPPLPHLLHPEQIASG
jgi:CBS domain-containing protein